MLALLNFTNFVKDVGYPAIFILSALQSCCVPTSSELTLGFAGYLAYKGQLNLAGAILAGVVGELVGAYIAYAVGRYGGRAFIDRYGKYVLLTHHDLDRAEGWYHRHERWGVFGSRLLPVIRNFVAVPAGVAEVPVVRFGILTAAGSLIWLGAMAGIGYEVGSSYDKVMKGFSDAGYVIAVVAVAIIAFGVWHRLRSFRAATAGAPAAGRAGAGRPGSGRSVAGRPVAGRPVPGSAGSARATGTVRTTTTSDPAGTTYTPAHFRGRRPAAEPGGAGGAAGGGGPAGGGPAGGGPAGAAGGRPARPRPVVRPEPAFEPEAE